MAEEIIEVGRKCTISPDNQVEHEIIEVKFKIIKIVLGDKTKEIVQYYVNVKEIKDRLTIRENIKIEQINLINE